MLSFLADEILQTSAIRTELKCREGMEDEVLEEAQGEGPWRVGQSVEARAHRERKGIPRCALLTRPRPLSHSFPRRLLSSA